MLGNIEARSHLEPEKDPHPKLSAVRKRIIVSQRLIKGVSFERQPLNQGVHIDQYTLTNPPLGIELCFTLGLKEQYAHHAGANRRDTEPLPRPLDLHIKTIDLKDKDLYGQGFGTELLRQAVAQARADRLASDDTSAALPVVVSTTPANLGLLNTIAKLAGGLRHVSARMGGIEYGHGHQKSLEEAIVDFPYDENSRYFFDDVEARIGPEPPRA